MRILVIEDEPGILAFLAGGLEASGYSVDRARDGREGLERALRDGYDLVVLDLLLPGLDGLSLLRSLKRERAELPVLILSARSDLATKLLGFRLGADDYLAKPFSFDELLARVRVRLRNDRPAPGGAVIRAGELVLDIDLRQVRSGAEPIPLSDREFRLLRCLIEDEGRVVPRDRLLLRVWGHRLATGSNVVDVYVRRLRRKLGARARIETVRQVGYRLAQT